VPGDLPPPFAEADSLRRTADQVALRAMALCICAVKGEGLRPGDVERTVARYDIAGQLTPGERAFIENRGASTLERIRFSWRFESCWALLWALRFVDELPWPDAICDVRRACLAVRERDRETFRRDADLRPQPELLDAADLAACIDAACRGARRRKHDPPADLDAHVARERHAAFTWLTDPHDRVWDEVVAEVIGA
jgi:hypothetical protein